MERKRRKKIEINLDEKPECFTKHRRLLDDGVEFAKIFAFKEEFVSVGRNCKVDGVKRSTGGGAVVHGGDICFALTLRTSSPAHEIYRKISSAIVKELEKKGLKGISTNDKGDIIVGGAKVCGMAMAMRKNMWLVEGSLRLRKPACVPPNSCFRDGSLPLSLYETLECLKNAISNLGIVQKKNLS